MDENSAPPPHRPLPIRIINAVGKTLADLGIELPRINEERLLAEACKQTGCDDFGPDTFREGLRVLLDSLHRDAKLNQIGRLSAKSQILTLLRERLRFIDYRKRHPELEEETIERPLFVVGLPRTGTTLLYGLLAQDPATRSPTSWEIATPCPPPTPETYETDPRIDEFDQMINQVKNLVPEFDRIHPLGARLPQECVSITAHEFRSVQFEISFNIPSYQRWLLEQDMRSAYEFHHQFLQHLQSQFRGKRWVLKSPAHLNTLDTLFEQYPDAMIVQTHRNPVKVMASVASLEYSMRGAGSDANDPFEVGQQQPPLWSKFLGSAMAARDAHPEWSGQFVDVLFRELLDDPMQCVKRIYERFDLELTDETETRMNNFLAENRRDKHGTHHYTLEMFGLEEENVRRDFETYCERFELDELI